MKQVNVLSFADGYAVVQFMDIPNDVRDSGRVVVSRQIEVSLSHPDYREAVRKLHDRAVALVEDALDNWNNSTPYTPDEADDDDERGMGE